ncbi:hypothetical protein KFL_003170050 [Klebsormidium nitens]|uniref:Transmembrane 9 superfamily member n=1 Tax=Klebsormidium nitens TaxID=105231 RepID=A0A1Y1IDR5_KLENI|nr:hypothetical protein KFL_003170050 [Klebsormidium nitens]|eukprot:GAQ86867.1 hypothetical protein KFL_003170050 [Klebsormidium nitens]
MVGQSRASYHPKATPRFYMKEEEIAVSVTKMTSAKTRFHFLAAQTMLKRQQCLVSCKLGSLSKADATAFKERIEAEYRVHMTLDGLPIATVRVLTKDGVPYKAYDQGYPIGFKALDATGVEHFFLYNHLRFYVLYYKETYDAELGQIVGFEVEPLSAKHKYEAPWNAEAPLLSTCNPMTMTFVMPGDMPQALEMGEEIIFTYDVVWMVSDIPWARRWDTYLLKESTQN